MRSLHVSYEFQGLLQYETVDLIPTSTQEEETLNEAAQ